MKIVIKIGIKIVIKVVIKIVLEIVMKVVLEIVMKVVMKVVMKMVLKIVMKMYNLEFLFFISLWNKRIYNIWFSYMNSLVLLYDRKFEPCLAYFIA